MNNLYIYICIYVVNSLVVVVVGEGGGGGEHAEAHPNDLKSPQINTGHFIHRGRDPATIKLA